MTLTLRIFLIVISLLTSIFVIRKIRKAQMKLEDTIFWLVTSFALIIISIFPQIVSFGTNIFGIFAEVNFVFLAVIFLLLMKVFSQSVKISQLENKINNFVQEYSVNKTKEENSEKSE